VLGSHREKGPPIAAGQLLLQHLRYWDTNHTAVNQHGWERQVTYSSGANSRGFKKKPLRLVIPQCFSLKIKLNAKISMMNKIFNKGLVLPARFALAPLAHLAITTNMEWHLKNLT
jgi:hypothetical protein